MAVDVGQHLAAILGGGQVAAIYLEMLPIGTGDIGARHVLAARGGLNQHPAGLSRVGPLGVRADLVLQLLADTHGHLELTIRLAPIEPPKRRVLPRILQLLHQPPQRSRAGLAVG